MNLFLLLSQLGLAADLSTERLLPVGTLYDPFVCRGLDALIYAVYSGARFVVAGTPSGVTLAPEGGAHQSTITASIGLELPNTTFCEPAFAGALDWLLCDAFARIAAATDGAYYFRLTTRPLDQAPFAARAPVVTVHGAASHALAWLGSALGTACVPLGVDSFGQSGRVADLYELHDLAPGAIVNAALAAVSLGH